MYQHALHNRMMFAKPPAARVIYEDPDYSPEVGVMRFRLTYQGPLMATQNEPAKEQRDKRAENKHAIRTALHRQLRRLWETTPALNGNFESPEGLAAPSRYDDIPSDVAYGWRFVPLVTRELRLLCGIDILFLRPDVPGGVVNSGDIDNRLKTLFDALRIPVAGERYADRAPSAGEDPFFCLLEDDSLITKLSVETDYLLEDVEGKPNPSDVRLVMTITVRPFEMHPVLWSKRHQPRGRWP